MAQTAQLGRTAVTCDNQAVCRVRLMNDYDVAAALQAGGPDGTYSANGGQWSSLKRRSLIECCIEEKASGAQVCQVGIILDNPLRHKSEALCEIQRFRIAFRQHCESLLNLDEVGLHGSEAVCMHQQEFRAIHWMPTSKKALKTVPSNPKPSIFTSPYEVNLQRAPARRCSPRRAMRASFTTIARVLPTSFSVKLIRSPANCGFGLEESRAFQ